MQVIINMEVTVVNATAVDSSDMAKAEGCTVSRVYTQVICVKIILISALLAFGYCIYFTNHAQEIYTGVSFQLKQDFPSVYNYQT